MTKKDLELIKEILEDNYSEQLAADVIKCIKNNIDAGSIIYNKEQEKYSGGSGPVCLPLILFNKVIIFKRLYCYNLFY